MQKPRLHKITKKCQITGDYQKKARLVGQGRITVPIEWRWNLDIDDSRLEKLCQSRNGISIYTGDRVEMQVVYHVGPQVDYSSSGGDRFSPLYKQVQR